MNTKLSDPQNDLLQAQGASWIMRKAITSTLVRPLHIDTNLSYRLNSSSSRTKPMRRILESVELFVGGFSHVCLNKRKVNQSGCERLLS
jgi:hypothetical protein